VLFGQHGADEANDSPRSGKIPMTSVRRWISLLSRSIVILSSANSVLNVRHEVSRSRVLCAGRGYLQSSRKQSLRRDDARSAGCFTGLVA
jgi:hypothetical protein